MKLLFVLVIFISVSYATAPCGGLTSCTAASCNAADVVTAVNSVDQENTTITIPGTTGSPQSCTWGVGVTNAPLTFTLAHSMTIQGGTVCTPSNPGTAATTCTDGTTIVDHLDRSFDDGIWNITLVAGKSLRITGLTFAWGGGTITSGGSIRIGGTSSSLRIDHTHFANLNHTVASFFGEVYGVIDHVVVDMAASNWNGFKFYLDSLGGIGSYGDESFAESPYLGSSKYLYVEDSTINTGAANDCQKAGRWAFRYNIMNNSDLQTHPTGGDGRGRGCRAWEAYNNTFPASVVNFNTFFISSGTGVIWGNSAPTNYSNFITIHSMRLDNITYGETAPPNGWGYCGTGGTCGGSPCQATPSAWDQNTSSVTGYACLDQPGRGKGDLLGGGNFPGAINTATGTIAWPRQAIEPVYEWNNTWATAGGGSRFAVYGLSITPNQDFYANNASFNGTSGVGSGLLSARPSTCTPNPVTYPGGNSPGVGYWATDDNNGNGRLWVCNSTNNWSPYYTPYTYPHPLQSGQTGIGTNIASGVVISSGAKTQ